MILKEACVAIVGKSCCFLMVGDQRAMDPEEDVTSPWNGGVTKRGLQL